MRPWIGRTLPSQFTIWFVGNNRELHIANKLLRIALLVKLAIKATDNSDMYSREFPTEGNFLFFVVCMMSLLCLPCGKFSLAFLAVPAGKDGRVECPRQTFDGFIGIRGNICGFFLFVQTHAPLIVPLRQRRAGKSKFQFLSGARARMLSALHLRLVARWWLTSACRYATFSSFSISSNCAIYALCCFRIFMDSIFT